MTEYSTPLDAAVAALGEEQVCWQPLGMLPVIANLIDGGVNDTARQIATLSEVRAKPHVFDDALVDRTERVYREQFHYIEIYAEQLRRWRNEQLTAAQRREIDRLEIQISRLRDLNTQALDHAAEIRKGTINRVMEKSDLELGLEAIARMTTDKTQ
jgi:hypothetical protein